MQFLRSKSCTIKSYPSRSLFTLIWLYLLDGLADDEASAVTDVVVAMETPGLETAGILELVQHARPADHTLQQQHLGHTSTWQLSRGIPYWSCVTSVQNTTIFHMELSNFRNSLNAYPSMSRKSHQPKYLPQAIKPS